MGAPGSPKRTWAENDIFRLLSAGRLSNPEWIQLDGQFKAIVGFARLFRPRYALANLGHPSSSYGVLSGGELAVFSTGTSRECWCPQRERARTSAIEVQVPARKASDASHANAGNREHVDDAL